MRHVITLAVFFGISLLFPFQKVHADFSDYESPTVSSTNWAEWVASDNAIDGDLGTNSPVLFNANGQSHEDDFSNPGFSTLYDISYIEFYITLQRSNGSGVVDMDVRGHPPGDYTASHTLCYGESEDTAEKDSLHRLDGGTSEQTFTFTFSNNEGVSSCVSDWFDTYAHDINDAEFHFTLANGTLIGGVNTISVKEITMRVFYEVDTPSVSFDSSEASASAQLVKVDLSGDTATASATTTCRIDIFENCTREGYAGWMSTTPVAKIRLNPSNEATETAKLAGNEYQGTGYTASSSAWIAENIELPYNPGYTCTYPTQTICVDQEYTCSEDDPPLCAWGSSTVVADFYDDGTGTEVSHTETYTEPEPTNPLAWIMWKIRRLVIEMFEINSGYTSGEIYGFRDNLEERAPFAYVVPIFDIDFSDPEATSSSIPSIEFDFPHVEDTTVYTAPASVSAFITTIRTTVKIFLWLSFIAYLFFLGRRII